MKFTFKKVLLAGSAIVAVSSFTATTANAAALTFTSGANTLATGADTWDIAAQPGFTNAALTYTGAGAVGVTATGTGTANIGAITVVSDLGANTFVLGNNTLASNLIINGNVSGDVTTNDLSFSVLATGNTSSSSLNFKGNVNIGTAAITLDSGTAGGIASTIFSGTTAQTVTGRIDGAVNGDGVVSVTNTGGTVTFNSNLGNTGLGHIGTGGASGTATTVFAGSVGVTNASGSTGGDGKIVLGQTDGGSSNTTFKAGVLANSGIVLGSAAGATADTNTVTFDATGASFGVTGAISAADAANTDTIVIAGGTGKIVTFNSDMGTNVDTININAATQLTAGTLNAAVNLGAGATLSTTTDGKTFTGNINGAGSGLFNNSTTVVGSLGDTTALTSVTVATAKTLTVDATAANRTVNAALTQLIGTATLALTNAANTITVSKALTSTGASTSAITTTGGAGTITFAGGIGTAANKIASLTPADNATTSAINVNGDLYVTTTTLGQNDTLNLVGTTGTASDAILGAGAGKGSVVVGNGTTASNYTFGGVLGGTTLAGFKVSTASTATVTKNVSTTASGAGVNGVESAGKLNVDTTAGAVTLSTLVGKTVLNGTTTLTGANSATISGVAADTIDGTLSTTLTGAARTLTLSGAGGVQLGTLANTTINAGNQIVLGNATTIGAVGRVTTLNVVKTADFNPTAITAIAGGANAVTVAGTMNVGIGAASQTLASGDVLTLITSTGGSNFGTLISNGTIVLQGSGLVKLTNNASDATMLRVTANFADPATILATQSNAAVATSLENNTTTTGNLATARQNLLNAPTVSAANTVAESLAPAADNAAMTAALDVTDSVFSMTSLRLADARTGAGNESGMAAGNYSQGHRAWGQAFGRTATQDRRNGTAGYDADTGGAAFGMDGETGSGSHVGVAVSYARTNIDSDNANKTETDIDSYQVSLYGDMPLDEHMFLNGMAAYVFNQNETTRKNVGGIAGVTANGDFDANQFVAQLELGRDFKQTGGLTLTPSVMANYSYYDASSYTETGAGTANLNVNSDSVSALNLGVGVDAVWDIENHDGSKLQPSLNVGYRYDVIGDSLDNNASFTGGGAAFTAQGVDPARSTYTAGAGLKYFTTNNWELSARYTFDAKEDYTAHAGQVRAAYKF